MEYLCFDSALKIVGGEFGFGPYWQSLSLTLHETQMSVSSSCNGFSVFLKLSMSPSSELYLTYISRTEKKNLYPKFKRLYN
jgi:hypothetical protein